MSNRNLFLNSFIFLLFLIPYAISAQSADEIIRQHLENSGGINKWKNLNSITLKGDVTLGVGETFPIIVYHRRPYQKKVVFIQDGKELLSEGYDGKNGWTYNEISGKNEMMKDYQPDSFESDLLDYKKKGFDITYSGKDSYEGKECYKVILKKFTNSDTYCFSTNDYSLLWEENKDEKINYFDYKSFGGLDFATKMISHPVGGGEYVIKWNQIQINPAIDDKIFKF